VNNIYGSSINNTYKLKFLLERQECCKDTEMETYDITKLVADLKTNNVQNGNKLYYFDVCFGHLAYLCYL